MPLPAANLLWYGAVASILTVAFMLQHPGFDFSGAKFSGEAPDPRSFMGGVKPER